MSAGVSSIAARRAPARGAASRGFTLLEMLIAMAILVLVTSVVYISLSSVVNSVTSTRVGMEEMRLRQFLARNFSANFSAAYMEPSYEQEVYNFFAESDDGPDGPRDRVRFVSTAPLMGGMALPGDIKEVRYEVLQEDETEMELDIGESMTGDRANTLAAAETPLLAGNVQELAADDGSFVPDAGYESPSWTVPVQSMRLRYFDGEEWLDGWDSLEMGRMPWAVEIRINFARPEGYRDAERQAGIDAQEHPDFEMVIPISTGMGVIEDLRMDAAMMGSLFLEADGGGARQPDTGGGRGGRR